MCVRVCAIKKVGNRKKTVKQVSCTNVYKNEALRQGCTQSSHIVKLVHFSTGRSALLQALNPPSTLVSF